MLLKQLGFREAYKQHFLNFFSLPQGQGSFIPTFSAELWEITFLAKRAGELARGRRWKIGQVSVPPFLPSFKAVSFLP
jgi:hypothetical protein